MPLSPALPLSYHANFDGRTIAYSVAISARARKWRLVVRPGSGLTVVIPNRSRTDPQTLVERHADWILKHLDRLGARIGEAPSSLAWGSTLAYLGMALRLERALDGRDPRVEHVPGALRVQTVPPQSLAAIIETWYRERASEVIAERLAAVNAALAYTFRKVNIRDQKTRWGSCSTRGDLAFNWRLVMAPLDVIDYVVVHELVHLKDLSHSAAFWERVARIDPAYRLHRRWLNDHGASLRLGVPPPTWTQAAVEPATRLPSEPDVPHTRD